MMRDDYLMRQIEQLAAFIARAAGFNGRGAHEEALRETRRAWEELLHDLPRDLVDVVDPTTLAGMLRSPDRVRAAAGLLVEEGRARAGSGDHELATKCFDRARALLAAAGVTGDAARSSAR